MNKHLLGLGLLVLGIAPAFAADPPVADLTSVEVTATRTPEAVSRVPVSITVIGGDELRARGAHDLRSALSLVAGVEAPPGGDAGPAGAVPSLWGLHEFDAFLLVVDGIPWGGAFNPSIPTLDLNNVEKIEVLRGAAPVVYGATSFVGVIQVIHYPAGAAADRAQLSYGSYGSASGAVARALPQIGGYRESFALSAQRQRFSDPREQINNGKFMYRGAAPLLGGTVGLDGDMVLQRQAPPSPRPLDPGNSFVTPVDANFNPADARIDEHKYHFALRYSHDTPIGAWESTASYAHSNLADVRGFIRARMVASDPGDRGNNADYQNQDRGIIDSYFDTHLSQELAENLGLVVGADLLYGSGKQ
ncbi:MAG TPA: TonB-dependent receptor plug domain-containing protein, partial [Nevskia sp.]|nr:TonB-dependent receptor plug domain-containing protein [Nevskia sp.]